MRYLLDTNHWSYIQERHPQVIARLQSLPDEASLVMSVVSQAELLGGIELVRGQRRRQELLVLYREVIATVTEILPITSEEAKEFAKIFASLRRKGRPIETNDIWIAATARVHNLILVSNERHFHYIDGLQVEDWTISPAPDDKSP
jgi:tRNA(fMet)-specific endonuclease VapC